MDTSPVPADVPMETVNAADDEDEYKSEATITFVVDKFSELANGGEQRLSEPVYVDFFNFKFA